MHPQLKFCWCPIVVTGASTYRDFKDWTSWSSTWRIAKLHTWGRITPCTSTWEHNNPTEKYLSVVMEARWIHKWQMNKQITNDVNCILDYTKRSMESRLSESISFSDVETTAGIRCLVWDPLIPEGCQETEGGPV